MLSKRYADMLSEKDIIFEIAGMAKRRAREIGEEHVYNFSLGNPSVPAPEAVNQTIHTILNDTPTLQIHSYGPSAGLPQVREQLARSLNRRFGMDYQPEHLFMASGAAGALGHALRAVTEPGDEIIVFAPYFPEYRPYVQGAGLRLSVVPADVDSFQINFRALEERLNPAVTALLINSPNNPSGIVLSSETLTQLAALLEEKQRQFGHPIYLISDEPYRELLFTGTEETYPARFYDNTITCYSFSKSLSLPGERIGYLAVNPKAEQAMTIAEVCPQISRTIGCNGTSTLMQLTVGRCADLTSQLEIYERNKDRLFSALTEYGFSCVEPGGSFYMFPRSLEPDDVAFCKKATELDLFLVPGTAFGCPGHFRLAYCVPEERVVAALPRFRQLAERYQRQKG